MGSTPQIQVPELAKGLIREILSEPGASGTGSTSRTATLLIVLFTLGWVTATVYNTGKLDMSTVEAALAFMGGGGFTFYGVNRVTAGMQPVDKTIDKPPVA